MATPFVFEGQLLPPQGEELRGDPVAFHAESLYDSHVQYVLDLPNETNTKQMDFGTTPSVGCKMVAVKYDRKAGAPPVKITFGAGTNSMELSTGGFLVYFSPNPIEGISSMALNYTASGKVRIWLFG